MKNTDVTEFQHFRKNSILGEIYNISMFFIVFITSIWIIIYLIM